MTTPIVQSGHPLSAVRRTGTIIGIANIPATVTVAIGGDTTNPTEIPYLTSYVPVVNDVVVIMSVEGDHVVVGSILPLSTNTSTPYFEYATLNSFTLVNGFQSMGCTPGRVFGIVPSTLTASTTMFTVPFSGVYLMSASGEAAASTAVGRLMMQWTNTPGGVPYFRQDLTHGVGAFAACDVGGAHLLIAGSPLYCQSYASGGYVGVGFTGLIVSLACLAMI